MKKFALIVAVIVVALAVLLPFASKTPDGLQNLTATSENKQQPKWNGIMANYSAAIGDPYISTLVAGICGVGIVLAVSFAVGSITAKGNRKSTENSA